MTYTVGQQQNAYKKLPQDVRDLIMNNETTELISNILKEAGFNEEQANIADSEILWVMHCLQTLDVAITNIAKLSGRNIDSLTKLKSRLAEEIFSKYKIDINEFVQSNNPSSGIDPVRRNNILEQKTVDQNLPMVEEGEVAHDVPHVEESAKLKESPKTQVPDYRYDEGKDPYREPLV